MKSIRRNRVRLAGDNVAGAIVQSKNHGGCLARGVGDSQVRTESGRIGDKWNKLARGRQLGPGSDKIESIDGSETRHEVISGARAVTELVWRTARAIRGAWPARHDIIASGDIMKRFGRMGC